MRFHPGTRRVTFLQQGLKGTGPRAPSADQAQAEEPLSGAPAVGVAQEEETHRDGLGGAESGVEARRSPGGRVDAEDDRGREQKRARPRRG